LGKGERNRGRHGEATSEEPGKEKSEGKEGRNGEGNSKRNEQRLATLLQNYVTAMYIIDIIIFSQ
jgi:hypothetical protein